MTDNDDTQDQLDPAEIRLLRLLEDTRGAPLGIEPPPTERVIRTVRFERAVRNMAQTIGALAETFTDALTSLLGQPHQGGRR